MQRGFGSGYAALPRSRRRTPVTVLVAGGSQIHRLSRPRHVCYYAHLCQERIDAQMNQQLLEIEKEQLKKGVPDFGPGDTVRAWLKVVEGGKERLQAFEGVCIVRCRRNSLKETFTLRKISHGVGVERSVLTHSPRVDKIEVVRRGVARRARLYYLRDKVGKQARLKERRDSNPAAQNQPQA